MPPRKKSKRGTQDREVETGHRIRMRRIACKMSQNELGEALGVSFQQIQKYEKASNRVSSGRLEQIATALGTSPQELMGWGGVGEEVDGRINMKAYRMALDFEKLKPRVATRVHDLIKTLTSDDE